MTFDSKVKANILNSVYMACEVVHTCDDNNGYGKVKLCHYYVVFNESANMWEEPVHRLTWICFCSNIFDLFR